MALLVFNITGSAVTLAAGSPVRTIPASSSPPARGPAVNITSELRGLSGANYIALQAQVTGSLVEYEWTSDPEYSTGALVISGPAPGGHHATHATAASDAITVASTTPTNNAIATGLTVDTGETLHCVSFSKALQAAGVTVHAQDPGGAALDLTTGFTNPLPARTLNIARSAAGPASVTYTCFYTLPDGSQDIVGLDVASGGNTTSNIAGIWTRIVTSVDPVSTSDFTTGDGFSLGTSFTGTPTLSCNGVVESIVSSDATSGTIVPTTSPDGSKEFAIAYSESHDHTVTDPTHNHTQNAHTHNLS